VGEREIKREITFKMRHKKEGQAQKKEHYSHYEMLLTQTMAGINGKTCSKREASGDATAG